MVSSNHSTKVSQVGIRGRTRGDSDSSLQAHKHQAAEQRRRNRINERLEVLRKMVPHSERANTAAFLDELIGYINLLRERTENLENSVQSIKEAAQTDIVPRAYSLSAVPSRGTDTADDTKATKSIPQLETLPQGYTSPLDGLNKLSFRQAYYLNKYCSFGQPKEPATKKRSSRSSRSTSMAELAERLGLKTLNFSSDGRLQVPDCCTNRSTCNSSSAFTTLRDSDDIWSNALTPQAALPAVRHVSWQHLLAATTNRGSLSSDGSNLRQPLSLLGCREDPLDVLASAACEQQHMTAVQEAQLRTAVGLPGVVSLEKRQRIF
ncbi:hypothetical protein CEUSTIGMA_g5989.t1 [Chlamydomonas eustigma]|uniref:BHLH domain-containing protein n=1 Tax=Chlamydomonas eustigma TaxID=1157962 RepID=A0A250X6K2_9CHLO|nr:hypothetical protein CEUSTIGMA_g5989.t1 [Chlamydomonas eustigma]|eukprot:GAX78549.1 hypothetical protein CEUSTIGMA_g5989.t1 [Chlamydomonas eustigma]